MEVNYIFGVNRHLIENNDTVKQGYMVDSQGMNIKTGSPCLIFSNSKAKENPSSRLGTMRAPRKFVVCPFPTGYRFHPRVILDSHNNHFAFKEFEKTDFLDRIKTIETSSINPNKLIHAIDYVKEKGPLTFLIDDKKQLQDRLLKVVSKLDKNFKYKSVFFTEKPGPCNLREGEKVVFALSMVDIRNVLPVFNPTKVNGVMLHGAVIYPTRSSYEDRLYCSAEFFMLFSQYKDNLWGVDGDKGHTCQFSKMTDLVSVIKNYGKYYVDVGKTKILSESKMSKERGLGDVIPVKPDGSTGIKFTTNTGSSASDTYGNYSAVRWATTNS